MNYGRAYSPPRITDKEGPLRGQIRSREVTLFRADGVVFLLCSQSENHPGLAISGPFGNCFYRSSTPPCGDARRGMTPDSAFVHAVIARRDSFLFSATLGLIPHGFSSSH